MRVVDSRRLRGPNLQTREPAAVAEVTLEPGERTADAVAAWRAAVGEVASRLGWTSFASRAVARPFPGGVAFALPAPVDVLYEATEANEIAIRAATAALAGKAPFSDDPALAELESSLPDRENPRLVALRAAAMRRGVPFLWDDDAVTLGMARRSATYPVGELPEPDAVDWPSFGRIPVALVTGTNGKTTTARLLARMAKLAGLVPGNTSTDGVVIDGRVVEEGDWTGAEAARIVLRAPVDVAILETARGGILRRGLGVDACDVAVITNVANDHLGEFGVHDVATMARTKAVVGSVVRPTGHVVLCGDDPLLVSLMRSFPAPVVLFSTADPPPRAHVAAGGTLYAVADGAFARVTRAGAVPLARVSDAPLAFGGAAAHNVANGLAAAAAAWALGLPDAAVGEALRTFGADPSDNRGRGEVVTTRAGTRVLLDFGHNAAGMRELMRLAHALARGGRITSVHTLPGDRTQADVDGVTRAIAGGCPRRVVLWESEEYRRGRAHGAIAASMRRGLRAAGVRDAAITEAKTEREAVARALESAGPSDVVVVAPHIDREPVADLLRSR